MSKVIWDSSREWDLVRFRVRGMDWGEISTKLKIPEKECQRKYDEMRNGTK